MQAPPELLGSFYPGAAYDLHSNNAPKRSSITTLAT